MPSNQDQYPQRLNYFRLITQAITFAACWSTNQASSYIRGGVTDTTQGASVAQQHPFLLVFLTSWLRLASDQKSGYEKGKVPVLGICPPHGN